MAAVLIAVLLLWMQDGESTDLQVEIDRDLPTATDDPGHARA